MRSRTYWTVKQCDIEETPSKIPHPLPVCEIFQRISSNTRCRLNRFVCWYWCPFHYTGNIRFRSVNDFAHGAAWRMSVLVFNLLPTNFPLSSNQCQWHKSDTNKMGIETERRVKMFSIHFQLMSCEASMPKSRWILWIMNIDYVAEQHTNIRNTISNLNLT